MINVVLGAVQYTQKPFFPAFEQLTSLEVSMKMLKTPFLKKSTILTALADQMISCAK
jgi:hypothetical protein